MATTPTTSSTVPRTTNSLGTMNPNVNLTSTGESSFAPNGGNITNTTPLPGNPTELAAQQEDYNLTNSANAATTSQNLTAAQIAEQGSANQQLQKQQNTEEEGKTAAAGLTDKQASDALAQYDVTNGRFANTYATANNVAQNGEYSPEERQRLVTQARGAQLVSGRQAAENALNNNAGGGINPAQAAAISSQSNQAATAAGTNAAAGIDQQNAQYKLQGAQLLGSLAPADTNLASSQANIKADTADVAGVSKNQDQADANAMARSTSAPAAGGASGNSGQFSGGNDDFFRNYGLKKKNGYWVSSQAGA